MNENEFNLKLEEVEKSIEKLTKEAQDCKDMKDLTEDERFQRLIMKGLIEEESLAAAKALRGINNKPEVDAALVTKIKAFDLLDMYITGISSYADMAQANLEKEKEYRSKLVNGEVQ